MKMYFPILLMLVLGLSSYQLLAQEVSIADGRLKMFWPEKTPDFRRLWLMPTSIDNNSYGYKFAWRNDDGSDRESFLIFDNNGETRIGRPGDGNNLLIFNTERSWAFRQLGSGSSTHLELANIVGNNKDFIITTDGGVGIGTTDPASKIHVQSLGTGSSTIARFQYGTTAVSPSGFGSNLPFSVIEVIEESNYFDYNFRPNYEECNSPNVYYNLGTPEDTWNSIHTDDLIEYPGKCLIRPPGDDPQPIPSALDRLQHIETFEATTDAKNNQTIIYGVDTDQLEKAFPGLVIRDDKENIGVKYTRFAPIFVQAFKDQQTQLDEKDQRITELEQQNEAFEARLAKLESLLTQNTTPATSETTVHLQGKDQPRLEQNAPNPFNAETQIQYYLPKATKSAQLRITDVNGQLLKILELQDTGEGQVTIKTSDLPSGSYQYTLVVDGKVFVTKQMVLTK